MFSMREARGWPCRIYRRWLAHEVRIGVLFFFSSRRRHTRLQGDWSSDVCSSDLDRLEEAFGQPTDLPWKLYISPPHRPLGFGQYEYFHPTFLYESLWDLVVLGLLVGVLRARLAGRPGALFFSYVGLYSVGRFAIEALRLDRFWLGAYRVPQLASMLGIIVAVAGMAWVSRRAPSLAAR